ncbi:MAG: flagellar basal body protein [Candidatus Margulisbacteria bacterium]|nr:flagellar basal body protein [Candidatus Margulisiibacteriota bacterium]
MVDNKIEMFGEPIDTVEKAMEILTRRQEVIANNIANANTPNYKALTFDEELMQAVEREKNTKIILEDELADLAKNSLEYSSYVKMMASKFNTLRTIATQGRR